MRRIATLGAVVALLLWVSAAAALDVKDWTALPGTAAPSPLFGAGEDAWPATATAPWYHADAGPAADVRRGWVDFGKADEPATHLAVTHLWVPEHGEITLELRCDETARLRVDGEEALRLSRSEDEASHTLTVPRGKIQLQVEVRARAGERARFKLSAEAATDLGVTRDARRVLSRFEDTRLLPSVADLDVSPDGRRVLLLRRARQADGSRRGVLEIRNLESGRGAVVARGSISSPIWLNAERFAFRRNGGIEVHDVMGRALDVQLADVESLRRYDLGSPVVYLVDPGQDEPADPFRLTNLRLRLSDWSDRAEVRVRRGVSDLAPDFALTAVGDFHVVSFAVDRTTDPARVALVRKVPVDERPFFHNEIWLTDVAGSEHRLLTTFRSGFEIWPMNLAWSPDGTRLAFTCSRGETGDGQPDHNWADTDVWVLDVATGERRNLTADVDVAPHDRDGEALTWIDDATLVFAADEGHAGRVVILDAATGEMRRLTATIDGVEARVRHLAVAVEARTAHWIADTWNAGPRLMSADLDDGVIVDRGDAAPAAAIETAVAEPFVFTNASGDEIDGWLYRPVRGDEGPTPLIVYYYGGAISSLGGVNGTHQWLAANGYAVYVLNPRGAHTYGQEFADHHVNDWGPDASADVIEGVEALLAAHPELDRERIGCWGGSYGGFLTMSLLTRTDIFAAAVSMYGISNLASYWGEGIWGWTYGDMAMAGSYPWNRPDLYADRSPLFAADRITTPLLLLHGSADANVPPGESEQMFTALKVLGRDVELVRFAGEDHGISGTWENRVAHRTMMLEWFDRWLRDRPGGWNARWAE